MLIMLLMVILVAKFFLCRTKGRVFFRWVSVEVVCSLILTIPVSIFGLFVARGLELPLTAFISFLCFFGLIGLAIIYALPPDLSAIKSSPFSFKKQKPCPYCHYMLDVDANYCDKCHHTIARTFDYDSL